MLLVKLSSFHGNSVNYFKQARRGEHPAIRQTGASHDIRRACGSLDFAFHWFGVALRYVVWDYLSLRHRTVNSCSYDMGSYPHSSRNNNRLGCWQKIESQAYCDYCSGRPVRRIRTHLSYSFSLSRFSFSLANHCRSKQYTARRCPRSSSHEKAIIQSRFREQAEHPTVSGVDTSIE